jgi:phage recombination protein Bet
MTALALYEGKQLDLIRRTVAKDANDAEFDTFIHICKATRLDPLRRQAYCFVFGKNGDPKWRTMTVVTAIGGYRSIADRTGTYRPDEDDARIEYSEDAKNPATNPLGIVKAVVYVWKFSHGEWHRVAGSAHWDEYVPLKDGVIDTKKTGWVKMPRIMIAKVAEASALRKGWPDDFAGLEIEEEVDRRTIDITPSEMAQTASVQDRIARVGGTGVLIDWCDGEPLQKVPLGKFVDQVIAYTISHREDPARVVMWETRNNVALKEFWAHDKSGALEIKKTLEGVRKMLEAA